MFGPLVQKAVRIPNGASLSAPVALDGGHLLGYISPAAWTAAALTLEATLDSVEQLAAANVTWRSVFDETGTELVFTVTANRHQCILAPLDFGAFRTIRLRSGVVALPVNQGADRDFILVLR